MDIASMENAPRQGLTAQAQPALPPEITAERREVVKAVKAVNQARFYGQDRELTYSIDRQTKRVVTKLVDKNTGDVISQIPFEYVLRLAEEYQQKT